MVENIINNKKYVGQTIQKDIKSRWKHHKNVDKRYIGNILYNAYKKYGIENFKFKIICICFDKDTNIYEKDYIKKYNCIYPNGYNLLEGGNNKKHNNYTINILKEKLSGKNHPFYGKELSENHIKNIKKGLKLKYEKSNVKKEPINISKSINISNSIINYYKNNIISGKGKNIRVMQYDINNNFINEYYSLGDAARQINAGRTTITKACKGINNHKAKGYFWYIKPNI